MAVAIALAWIPVIKGAHGLDNDLQAVQGYLAPPAFVVFFFGVFFKRLNAKGCSRAMMVGLALGNFRMLVDTPVTLNWFKYDEGSFLWIVNRIYFQYWSALITIVSAVVVVVSYLSERPDCAHIQGADVRHGLGGGQEADAGDLERPGRDRIAGGAGL